MLRRGAAPPTAVVWGLTVASLVLGVSLGWLWLRETPNLRAQLGLTRGKGWRVVVREAALWSAPAVLILLTYLFAFPPRSSSLLDEPVAQQPLGLLLAPAPALTLVLVLCLFAPVLEELIFRGMLFSALRSGYGRALGVVVSSLLFMVDHTLLNAVPIFCSAVCMALAFERSRSLYAAMLVHAAYNGTIAIVLLSLR